MKGSEKGKLRNYYIVLFNGAQSSQFTDKIYCVGS